MNEDQVGEEERCASTSNRNFEGRQGARRALICLAPRWPPPPPPPVILWTFHANNSRQRGVIAVILVVFLAGGGLSFLLLNDSVGYFQNFKEQRRLRDEKKVAEAQQSLLQYMLLRSQYPYDIARPGGNPIHPRLLMLPCPDNVGDVGAGSGDKI